MKFLVFSVFLLYFLCFVNTAPEPSPLLNLPIHPPNSIVNHLSPLSDIVSCLIVEVFSIVISVLCVTYNIVINLSQFLECLIAEISLLGELGDILASVFNAIKIGARATNAACKPTFEIYRGYMNKTCIGVLPTLSAVTFALQGLASMTPTDVDCSCGNSGSFPLISCLIVEVTYLYAALGCALAATDLVEILNFLIKDVPPPLGTVLRSLSDGLYYGLWYGMKSTCKTILNVWESELKKLCPAIVITTNKSLKTLLALK